MHITATHINLYHVCQRELWLHANGITMEHNSEIVYAGKLVGEHSYEDRAVKNRQVEIGGVKIDFYDPKTKTVHETKKSDKMHQAHRAQVLFYLYILEQAGIEGAKGIIEYPKQRKRLDIELTDKDRKAIKQWIRDIEKLIESEACPTVVKKPICRSCSYRDFCFSDEL